MQKFIKTYGLWLLIVGWCLIVLIAWWPRIIEVVDVEYLENLYATSQWSIPLSSRIMSDSELYQLAGYRLAWEGADVTSINPETPPLGKYLYGLAIGMWGRPYLVSLIATVLAVISFAGWVRTLPEARKANLWALSVLLLMVSPLLILGLNTALLDIFWLLFAIWHWWALWGYYQRPTRWWYLVMSGLALGFFAGTKVPFFVPFIVMADVFLLVKMQTGKPFAWRRLAREIAVLGVTGGGGWLMTYTPFFLRGLTIVDWLRLQKWTLDFYLHASHGNTWLGPIMVWITSVTGWYQSGETWVHNSGWSILLPILVVYLVQYYRRRGWRQQDPWMQFMWASVSILLISNMFSSFMPRYLLILWPLVIILVMPKILQWSAKWRNLLVIVLLAQGVWTLYPTPEAAWRETLSTWEGLHFADVYWRAEPTSVSESTWRAWQEKWRQAEASLGTRKLELRPGKSSWVWPWQKEANWEILMRRQLASGVIWEETIETRWRRAAGTWKLVWDDNYFLTDHREGDKYEVAWTPAPGQQIYLDEQLVGTLQPAGELWVDKKQVTATNEATLIKELVASELAKQVTWENQLYVNGEGLDVVPLVVLTSREEITKGQALAATQSAIIARESESEVYPDLDQKAEYLSVWVNNLPISQPGVEIRRMRDGEIETIWSQPPQVQDDIYLTSEEITRATRAQTDHQSQR